MSKTLSLAVLRQIIMRLQNSVPIRLISRQLKINRKTVEKYSKVITRLRSDYPDLLQLNDQDLHAAVHSRQSDVIQEKGISHRKKDLLELAPFFSMELQRVGVTLKLLWKEYYADNVSGNPYGYVSFCRILRPALRLPDSSYHKRYSPGEVLMVDFAGDKVYYVDKDSAELIECVVYVGVLSYSNYAYVEVLPSAKLPFLIDALNNNLKFIQGVPITVLSDNMRQLVTKANRYEPTFTTAITDWANHNKTAIEACAVASPRQKSPVEGHVKLAYQRIYAPLRDVTFFSLQELKDAFKVKLEEFNKQNFQGRTYSRLTQFITEELPTLNPLPGDPFELKSFTSAKVQKNYHVMLGEDRHFYSVPVTFVGQSVQIIYNTKTVEIYYQMSRIATHQRNTKAYGYSTTGNHMPGKDKAYAALNGFKREDFIEQASQIGDNVKKYIEETINSRVFEQHAYNGCLGILRLGQDNSYGSQRLDRACAIGLALQQYSYKCIEGILRKGVDKKSVDDDDTQPGDHENLRGPHAF